MYKRELEVLLQAIEQASAAILEVYRRDDFGVEVKGDNSPVTIADKASNDILISLLSRAFPDYAILSEEAADDRRRFETEYVWIIDPLDGTKEFIKRNGDFSINVALVKGQRPVLGVVYVPNRDILYYAIKGQGAYRVAEGKTEQIHVSDRTRELVLVRSRSRVSERLTTMIEKDEIVTVKKVGSALKGCVVADGSADMYYSFGFTMEWDTASMDLIVHEAGGVFRHMNGELMKYNREDNLNRGGFVALNDERNNFI